ncbi:MAG: hypothetical protein ACYCV7_17275 [Acidimicrobiales bacterium]
MTTGPAFTAPELLAPEPPDDDFDDGADDGVDELQAAKRRADATPPTTTSRQRDERSVGSAGALSCWSLDLASPTSLAKCPCRFIMLFLPLSGIQIAMIMS